jgi:hypothetical protein
MFCESDGDSPSMVRAKMEAATLPVQCVAQAEAVNPEAALSA